MDRTLRRELDDIGRDTQSGAAELTLRGVAALQGWLARLGLARLGLERRGPAPRHGGGRGLLQQTELLEVAYALLHAQPSMAPLLRLANEAALAAEAADPRRSFRRSLSELSSLVQKAPRRIARQFAQALRPRIRVVATYSYSSTVLHALQHSRKRIARVLCSESRPGNEGRVTARQLAAAGIEVVLMTDAALLGQVARADVFVCGADAVEHFGFVNKVGTQGLVACARRARVPVWVLADTSKFLPKAAADCAPEGVEILNPYFELAGFFPGLRLLTEKGWMSPANVREALKKIRVSPRLRALASSG